MAPHRISASLLPVRRTALFGSALLAAVVATALLSAGEARAMLMDGPVTCEGLGTVTATCLPSEKNLFDNLPTPYQVSDNDPLFNITADETEINLQFPDPVTGPDLDSVGFRLTGLLSTPALVVGQITDICIGLQDTNCVDFVNWNDIPVTRPFVTDDGGVQAIEWTQLTGGDPQLGSIASIRLAFVPEPGTAALLGLGLTGLGVVGRSRRE